MNKKLLSPTIGKLIDILKHFPNVGEKVARRYSFYLLQQSPEYIEMLRETLKLINEKIKRCEVCFNYCEGSICPICKDSSRNTSIICVVEKPLDIYTIEDTGSYHGMYHVIDHLISVFPTKEINPNIEKLIQRILTNPVKEVFFALSSTVEGDTTVKYITEKIKDKKIKITQLARGIPTGSEISFLAGGVIQEAIKFRQIVKGE